MSATKENFGERFEEELEKANQPDVEPLQCNNCHEIVEEVSKVMGVCERCDAISDSQIMQARGK